MSQSGKVAKKLPPKRGKVQRRLALFLCVALALSAVVASIIWLNRTSLAENQIRKFMAKEGYDVTLDVKKLTKSQVTIANIVVSKDKDVFFKASRVVADYDLSERKALRVELVKPYLKVEFDIKGNITSPWMKQGTGNTESLALPPNGVTIKDATIDWRLMRDKDILLGTGQADVSADINSDIDWTANITGTKIKFNTDTLKGDIEHDIFIETKDGKTFDIFGSINGQSLRTELLPLTNLQTQSVKSTFKLNFMRAQNTASPMLTGWGEAHINGLSTQDYTAQNIDLKIEHLRMDTDGIGSADWQIDTKATRIRDDDMRANIANKLTVHNAMATTPIARHFTQGLYEKAEKLLTGFALDGDGKFTSSNTGYEINLVRPLALQGNDQTVSFTQKSVDFVQYNKANKLMSLQADMNWSGAQALELTNFTMDAKSATGIKLDTIKNMKARVHSLSTWRLHNDGDDIRLAPFDLGFAYEDQGKGARNINMTGGIDYDGPVPGGYVLGLKTNGAMGLQVQGGDFILGYTPSGPLSIGEFTNSSRWATKSLKFILEPQPNLLRKIAQSNIMRTSLKDVHTQIVGPMDKRHLDARFGSLDVTTNFAKSPQRWQVTVGGTDIKSENFPAPGTRIISPSAELQIIQSKGGQMTFDISSPATRVATDNALIENLQIILGGSPDDIALEYQAGSVTMVGGAVPVLPMHGTARLTSGELMGHAITNLPRTEDTPIDIHYRSKDGLGSAKILIPKIIFDPKGLQPQQLVPILRGKLAEVSGEVSAEFDFVFGDGQPVQSSGWADLTNLDIGTLVGPLSGINSQLTFTSIFPLKTDGIQTATMDGFDPGFPLNGGTFQFETIPDGIKLHQAQWPIENIVGTAGKIFLTPTDWQFGDIENLVTVNVEDVGLGTVLAGIGKDKLSATGQVFGTLPAKIKGVDILIDGGMLGVKDGGIIRYKSTATDAAATRNENAAHAFKALENFQYKQLEALIDGPIDGNMSLKVVFDGQNPDVLSGQPFLFNTVVNGELANIARNLAGAFSNEENLSRIIAVQKDDQNGQTEQP